MIVLIYGADAASARAEVESLLQAHDPTGAGTTRLDGRSVTMAQVIAAVGSVGFFTAKRVVVVDGLLARAGKPGKSAVVADDNAEEDAAPAPSLDLGPLFSAVPEENVLILVDGELAALPASIKKALPSSARIIAVEPPRGHDLIAWLMAAANAAGAELDRQTARFLAERMYPQTWSAKPSNPRFDRPPDLDRLRNEVDKLAIAAHPGPITRRHVQELVPAGDDDRVFRFVEAAANGELGTAITELARLQDAGEEPFKLAAQVYQQIELAAVLEAAGPTDPASVGRALGLTNPNRMIGIAASRRGQRPDAARLAVVNATDLDRRVKRGALRQPDDALYHLMTEAAELKSTAHATRRGGK